MTKAQIVAVLISLVARVHTETIRLLYSLQWNPDFNCPGCVLITTDASLIGTISEGPTTIATYTPPVATSIVVIPPVNTPAPPTPTFNPEPEPTTSVSLWNPDEPLTSTTPGTPAAPDIPSSKPALVLTTVKPIISDILSTVIPGPITSTYVVGEKTTKTFVFSTSTALILLVTDTQTLTTTQAVTITSTSTKFLTSTVVTPVSTFITKGNIVPGYYNVTNQDDAYKTTLTTLYSTYITSHEEVLQSTIVVYVTNVYEQVVTSTLIVWGTEWSESLSISSGLQTLVSTYFPSTFVTTIAVKTPGEIITFAPTQTLPSVNIPVVTSPTLPTTHTTTHTHTVTVTPTTTIFDACNVATAAIVAATSDSTSLEQQGGKVEIFTGFGYILKTKPTWGYVLILLFPLLM